MLNYFAKLQGTPKVLRRKSLIEIYNPTFREANTAIHTLERYNSKRIIGDFDITEVIWDPES